jgi:hypothetical protein
MSFLSHKGDIMTAQKYIVLVKVENANREDVECYEGVKFYDTKNFIETSKLDAVVMPISDFTNKLNDQEINLENYWMTSILLEHQSRCIYCDSNEQIEDFHFACEICGDGMCDDCYDSMTEHDGHYHLPLENCDSEMEIKLITKACGNDNPAYICEACMTKVMTDGEIAYIKEDLKNLVGTRWKDREHLQKHLQDTYELSTSLNDIDESGLVADYAFIMGIFEHYGYMDIYYLKIPFGDDETIYITEVLVSAE